MKKILSLLMAAAFVLTFGMAFAQEDKSANETKTESNETMKKDGEQTKKKKKTSKKKKKKTTEEKTAPTGTM